MTVHIGMCLSRDMACIGEGKKCWVMKWSTVQVVCSFDDLLIHKNASRVTSLRLKVSKINQCS